MNKQNKEKYLKLKEIFNIYKLTEKDKRFIWKVIKPIYCHDEFQRRMIPPFFHHCDVTVGEHILGDTILVYLTCKKNKIEKDATKRAMIIAMFHDLYELPWKNAPKRELFVNFHAFTHPIEAIVNAINWFPKYFENLDDAKIIIDGVLHHMYPCPVRSISLTKLELNNMEKYENLSYELKKIICFSLESHIFNNFSLRRSFYFEGRVVHRVDKLITIKKDLRFIKTIDFIKSIIIKEKTN